MISDYHNPIYIARASLYSVEVNPGYKLSDHVRFVATEPMIGAVAKPRCAWCKEHVYGETLCIEHYLIFRDRVEKTKELM